MKIWQNTIKLLKWKSMEKMTMKNWIKLWMLILMIYSIKKMKDIKKANIKNEDYNYDYEDDENVRSKSCKIELWIW